MDIEDLGDSLHQKNDVDAKQLNQSPNPPQNEKKEHSSQDIFKAEGKSGEESKGEGSKQDGGKGDGGAKAVK